MVPSRGQVVAASAIALVLAGVLVWLGGDEQGANRSPEPVVKGVPAAADAPNLLVVMVDDQPVSAHDRKAMPAIHDFFADAGTTFDQAITAPPLCCPSRAGFLTGRYTHNHGVVENTVGYRSLKGKDRTFPVALQAADYRTAMIGKFLNGYEPDARAQPAPGFDRWYAIHGYADYFDFQVSDNGELKRDPGYATESLTSQAIRFTRQASADEQPFFLWLSYNAPHTINGGYKKPCNGKRAQPAGAAAYARFANERLPRPTSFNNPNVAERPSLQGTDPVGFKKLRSITGAWRCARASLAGVDEQFARLIADLRESGELETTLVVYLSDNGYYYGEHRLTADKRLPLEPALRIPMAIRAGTQVASDAGPRRTDALVSQVDLAPTLLDYAGVDPCPGDAACQAMDGRSLKPLLTGDAADWPANRAIPMTLDDGWEYEAIRTPTHLYMEIASSRKQTFSSPRPELYDLRRDPDQLHNLAGRRAASAIERTLRQRLRSTARRSR